MSGFDYLTASTDELRKKLGSRKPSGRKFRLFMVACCRLRRGSVSEPRCLALIDLIERVADGTATAAELGAAREDVHRWCHAEGARDNPDSRAEGWWMAKWGAYQAATDKPTKPVYGFVNDPVYRPLLADVIGPLPKSFTFDPAWRTDTTVSLARQMYELRDFSAMPILADALEDAGCATPEVLDHCRGSAPHVRGCWVVDFVLTKE